MNDECTKCGAPISRDDTKYVFKKDDLIHCLCIGCFNHVRTEPRST